MKKLFLKTTILTISVFIIAFFLGIWFDSLRLEEVKITLTDIDNLWNDARLLYSFTDKLGDVSCDFLLKENHNLGDKIYAEGLKIEEYEKANRFIPSLLLEKKRYALLDLQFWINSIELKKLCNANYATIIYFYSHYEKTAEQKLMENLLWEFKQKCGPKTIYITLPVDLDISTINTIKNNYNITKTPSLLINETVVIKGLTTMEELKEYVEC